MDAIAAHGSASATHMSTTEHFFPENPDRRADAKTPRLISQTLRAFWQLPHNFAVNFQFQYWQTWKHGLMLQAK